MNVVGDPSQTTLSDFELLDGMIIGGLLPIQYFKTCCDNLLIHHRTANSSCYFDVYHYFSDVFKNHFKETWEKKTKNSNFSARFFFVTQTRTALRCACAPLFASSWPAFAFIVICELTASAGPILEQDN